LSALVQEVESTAVNRLELQHLIIIDAAIRNLPNRQETQEEAWTYIIGGLRDFLCLGLCTEDSCVLSANILFTFLCIFIDQGVEVFPLLLRTLLLLFPNNANKLPSSKCQDTAIKLLLHLYDSGQPLTNAVTNLVKNFPEYLGGTRLDIVIDKVYH